MISATQHPLSHPPLFTLAGNELYAAYEEYELEALLAEVYEGTGATASYFGVGMVKASECGPGRPFTGLNRESLEVRFTGLGKGLVGATCGFGGRRRASFHQ